MAALKSLVKTLSGTSAQALGAVSVAAGALVYADSGDTVYIGGEDLNGSTNGFLLPTTPGDAIPLGVLTTFGKAEAFDLSQIYVQGADGDKVRVLYPTNPAS